MDDNDEPTTYNISPSVSAMIEDEQLQSQSAHYFSINLKALSIGTIQDFLQNEAIQDVSSLVRLQTGIPVWDFMYGIRVSHPTIYDRILALIGSNPYWGQPAKPYPVFVKLIKQFSSLTCKYEDVKHFAPLSFLVRVDGALLPSVVGTECFVQPVVIFEQLCSGRRTSFVPAFEFQHDLSKILLQIEHVRSTASC
jgi:hypothetical protein